MTDFKKIKNLLEIEYICNSLNGRIEYDFSYNEKSSLTTVTIFVDGEKVVKHNVESIDNLLNNLSKYKNEEFLNSDDPIEQIIGIFDGRIHKRDIKKLKQIMDSKPEWLQYLYSFRLQAEGYTA